MSGAVFTDAKGEEFVIVRGVPVPRWQVEYMERRYEGEWVDESRPVNLQIIRALDAELHRQLRKAPRPGPNLPLPEWFKKYYPQRIRLIEYGLAQFVPVPLEIALMPGMKPKPQFHKPIYFRQARRM